LDYKLSYEYIFFNKYINIIQSFFFGVIISCIVTLTNKVNVKCLVSLGDANWMVILMMIWYFISRTHDSHGSGTYDVGKTIKSKVLNYLLSPALWLANIIKTSGTQT